jgi:hypothetical protein
MLVGYLFIEIGMISYVVINPNQVTRVLNQVKLTCLEYRNFKIKVKPVGFIDV